MERAYLINYLEEQGCYPEPDGNPVAEMWCNCINGEMCYVPNDNELATTTYCHIFYELKIPPPLDNGYEADYYVYEAWREYRLKEAGKEQA